VSRTLLSRASCRAILRVAVLAATLVVVGACGGDDKTTPTVPATVAVTTTVSTSTSAPTTGGGATTSTTPTSAVTTVAGSASTTVDPSTVTTIDPSQNFDFKAPTTDQKDVGMLDVYRNFMEVQEQIGHNLSDRGLRAQLAAITTSDANAALQKAFDGLVAQGASYQVVEPATYHPFVLYGEGYRDGFRTVGDCFVEAAAYVDSAGTPLPGETLSRVSKGFVVEFELHGGKWLASSSRYDPAECLVKR
jgi:hypothetical protein